MTIGGQTINAPNSLPEGDIAPSIINNGLTIFITAGIIAALITIIWSGIQWASSSGDKQKVASARARLTWGIIGLVIILISVFIVNVLSSLFGINLLNFSL